MDLTPYLPQLDLQRPGLRASAEKLSLRWRLSASIISFYDVHNIALLEEALHLGALSAHDHEGFSAQKEC
jgi:hypothetical protein